MAVRNGKGHAHEDRERGCGGGTARARSRQKGGEMRHSSASCDRWRKGSVGVHTRGQQQDRVTGVQAESCSGREVPGGLERGEHIEWWRMGACACMRRMREQRQGTAAG